MKKIIFSILIFLSIFMITIKVNASNDVTVSIYDGASIRTNEPTGIRFKAQVTNPQTGYKYGMVFINHKVSNIEELYVGSTNSVNAEVEELTSTNEYTVSMVNLPEYGYLDDITARAYVKIADNKYIYSDTVTTRTIKEVAEQVYENNQSNEYINNIALFNKTILVRYDLLSITVDYNTPSNNLNLPKTVTLYDKYDQAYNVNVNWDLSNYDGTKSGSIKVSGVLELGETYITKRFEIYLTLTVKAYIPSQGTELFNYYFLTLTTLDSTWDDNSSGRYAENSIALKAAGKYITTPSFNALGSFTVYATIKGRSSSGNAQVTIYGLDDDGNVLETHPFAQVISTSDETISATFTNLAITKIKFEYTKKATGNVGISLLRAEYTGESGEGGGEVTPKPEEDVIESISYKDYTSSYYLGKAFDYAGTIVKNYSSGKTEEISLSSIKDDVNVVFDSSSKGSFEGSITYLGFTTKFTYDIISQDVTSTITSKVDNVTVYSLELTANSKDAVSLISIIEGTNRVNIVVDQGATLSDSAKTVLNQKLESLIDYKISYYYSKYNSSYFSSLSGAQMVLNNEYSFTKEVLITIKNNGFLLDCFGYIYYDVQNMTNSQIDTSIKADILWTNGTMTTSMLKSLDPETIILPEGNMASFLELAKTIYTYDDEIFQYSPTLNDSIWHIFTDTSYTLDGESTTELSSYSEWSNSETNGLHHASMVNYLYREAYYGDIRNLSGAALRSALNKVITDTHTYMVSYGENKTYLAQTDADPFNEGKLILIYLGTSVASEWDAGTTWNREHVWPKSLSGGLYKSITDSHRGAGSDLHNLKPSNPSENSSRGNKPFGTVTNSNTYCPRDAVKGDVARILFYMSVRYDMDIEGLDVAESTDMLLEWNELDQIDSFERNRNKTVQGIQGNYNPFIDNPWLADLIW